MQRVEMRRIVYIGYRKGVPLRCRRFDGICRFARTRGWEVIPLDPDVEKDPEHLRETLARLDPVGVIREGPRARRPLTPRFFAPIPAVCIDPPAGVTWRGAAVVCDEAAVAKAAFCELSSGLPPAYAVISHWPARGTPWARSRVKAFRALCRAEGKPCLVFPERREEDVAARAARLTAWVAALPLHCAVFAVSDYAVQEDIARAFAAAGRSLPRTATLVGVDAVEVPGDGAIAADVSSVRIDFELSGFLAAKSLTEKPNRLKAPPSFGPLLVERRKSTRGRGRREPWILDAVEAIRRKACDGLTAAALINNYPVSKRLFNLRFREAMGHSVHDEIIQVRLESVFALLADTDTPVGAIADMCGFGSAVELRQVFKAKTKMSMTEWRARHR